MNFFFFLNHEDKDLQFECDIFNFPSAKHLSEYKPIDRLIIGYYSDGKKWHSKILGEIKAEENLTLNKSELPSSFANKSLIFSLYPKDNYKLENIYFNNTEKSTPAWRCNTRIKSPKTSTSYQGEFPSTFLKRKLSLVSCSPMLQFKENVDNYLFLVNFSENPEIKNFELTCDDNFGNIENFTFMTNSINSINLTNLMNNNSSNFLITKSKNFGGVPIYFTKSKDNSSMSIEHTHPPTEYIFLGERFHFQKKKKKFYFEK